MVCSEVVQYLVEQFPLSVKVKSKDGRLPLHGACQNDEASLEMVTYLVDRHPDATEVKDANGHTPLQLA
jgi:ankyrin repeat protein